MICRNIVLGALGSLFAWFKLVDVDLSTYFSFNKDKHFKGKVVLITGASGGIGRAVAERCAKAGANIVLVARRQKELSIVEESCLKLGAAGVLTIAADVCDLSVLPGIIQSTVSKFGRLDVVLSNAGRTQRSLAVETEIAVTQKLFDLNVMSVIELTRLAVVQMQSQPKDKDGLRGQVGVVSSTAGKIGSPGSSSYSASKFAVLGYYTALRNEVAQDGIHVGVFCPGPIHTDIAANALTATLDGSNPSDEQNERKMTVERCAELMTRGFANQKSEVWIAENPFLMFMYFAQYLPSFTDFLGRKMIGPARVRGIKTGDTGYKGLASPIELIKGLFGRGAKKE